MRIVLATGNPHKVDEMRAIFAREGLAALGVKIVGLKDLPDPHRFHEPEEHGTTFEENATIKALSYAQQTGEWCLADDSGLEIDALGGKPGIISSHYCTDGVDTGMTREQRDAANNDRVLKELEGVPMEHRAARFVCVMVLTAPPATRGGSILPSLLSRGVFEGRIGSPPRVPAGTNGFGYDPLFLVAPAFVRTSAEMPSDEKNAGSHRAAAARAMAEHIAALARGFSAEA
ncbi:MAG TPA: non-canonical purine NTP pyrophosphatase [Phycisphaerales bacterium]|nr:non-canonical purine NTP pyrophosphatase [Phycisphaerales bacterium]